MESAAQRLIALVTRITDEDVDLDAPITLDSLSRIELAVRIEQEFGKPMEAFSATTLREVVNFLEA
ncbi:MAG: acyl carrier protein [Corynebacterium sp.]|nr:acyl carrier protein [Corynebacterium sp.]